MSLKSNICRCVRIQLCILRDHGMVTVSEQDFSAIVDEVDAIEVMVLVVVAMAKVVVGGALSSRRSSVILFVGVALDQKSNE